MGEKVNPRICSLTTTLSPHSESEIKTLHILYFVYKKLTRRDFYNFKGPIEDFVYIKERGNVKMSEVQSKTPGMGFKIHEDKERETS